MRYARMRVSAFAFLRATDHLYYARAHRLRLLPKAPAGWLSGDLHLENFGSFRGANGLAYFDVNDFDEAVLAPGTWDALRLAASVLVWAEERGVPARERRALARIPLDGFAAALVEGKPRWVERATAEGPVRKLLRRVKRRSRQELLELRTTRTAAGTRRLLLIPGRALRAPAEERRKVSRALSRLAAPDQVPRFFKVLDVVRRVAGCGSLGLPRWVVLVEGFGSPDDNVLLDLKGDEPCPVAKYAGLRQPRWPSDAARTTQVQRWLQAESPALLSAVTVGRLHCVLKELQPEQDRIHLAHLEAEPKMITQVLRTMGLLAAWSLLRGARRRGGVPIDDWTGFARTTAWRSDLLERAGKLAAVVQADWRTFCRAYDAGEFAVAHSAPAGRR